MALPAPKDEDVRKLHAEINQIINQRFLLTTLAVTVFGAIVAWLIPKERQCPPEVSLFTYAGSSLLLTLLFVLFFFLHRLRAMSKTLAAYLILTDKSEWEKAWAKYRKKPYYGYTEVQATVFLFLIVLAASLPYLIGCGFGLEPNERGALFTKLLGAVYFITVCLMAFKNWWMAPKNWWMALRNWRFGEKAAKERWEEIKSEGADIKAVIFDIGGVLAQDVWEHLLLDKKGGIASEYHLDKRKTERVGKRLWEQFAHLPETQRNRWQELEEQYWNQFIQHFAGHSPEMTADKFVKMTDNFIKPVEGVIPLLERLHSKGVDLAICSNNTEFWFSRQMDKLNLHKFFRQGKVILSCRIGVSKSSPGFEMFHAVADALKIAKAQCVFVDDRKENVERAQQCGMVGIHFTNAKRLNKLLDDLGLFD